MSSTPTRALLSMPDGSLNKEHWSPQVARLLEAVMATLPPPPAGAGGFSTWRKQAFLPACTDQAAVLAKFTPQTLRGKVNRLFANNDKENGTKLGKKDQFFNFSRTDVPSAKATPAKRGGAPFSDVIAPNQNGNTSATGALSRLFGSAKKPKTLQQIAADDDEEEGIDLYDESQDDGVDELDSEDSVDDRSETKPTPKSGKINRSGDLPYMTTVYTDDAKKKRFTVIIMQVPRCEEVPPTVTVTDRTVTVDVPSLKYLAGDAEQIKNVIKGHANLSEEKAQEVSTILMKTVQQIKPWRYHITAPFQLNPNDVKRFVKKLHVGTFTSRATHDVLIIDIGEMTGNTTNDLLYIDFDY
jgi:hypothetical protein